MIVIPASSLQKNSKNYVKKTFQFITVCKGDMNHRKTKTAKIILGLNLGLYHHVLNPVALTRRAILNTCKTKTW